MASILPFIRKAGAVFDDRATQIMGEAFDTACKDLHDTGQPQIVYEVIAVRIINAAKNGERDPVRLRNAGLSALGLTTQRGKLVRPSWRRLRSRLQLKDGATPCSDAVSVKPNPLKRGLPKRRSDCVRQPNCSHLALSTMK